MRKPEENTSVNEEARAPALEGFVTQSLEQIEIPDGWAEAIERIVGDQEEIKRKSVRRWLDKAQRYLKHLRSCLEALSPGPGSGHCPETGQTLIEEKKQEIDRLLSMIGARKSAENARYNMETLHKHFQNEGRRFKRITGVIPKIRRKPSDPEKKAEENEPLSGGRPPSIRG